MVWVAGVLFSCCHLCAYFFLHVSPTVVLQQKICEAVVVAAVVWVPIVDVVVLWVEVVDDVDVVVVVGQYLLLLVGVFRLLELFWLNEVLMPMLGQVPVVSSAEVLAAA